LEGKSRTAELVSLKATDLGLKHFGPGIGLKSRSGVDKCFGLGDLVFKEKIKRHVCPQPFKNKGNAQQPLDFTFASTS
jgi:hypothetical protein